MIYIQLTLEGNCAHLYYKREMMYNYDYNDYTASCIDCSAIFPVSKLCRNAEDMTVIPV